MKKQFVLMAIAAVFSFSAVNAQGGGGQRMTTEERTAAAIEKMAPLNLSADVKSKADAIITAFYKDQQAAMEEMRSSGSFDREAFGVKRKEMAEARDKRLKEIFTEEQFTKWTKEIEPSINPPRGGGQRGGGK